jgi:hypothetical protein
MRGLAEHAVAANESPQGADQFNSHASLLFDKFQK